MLEEWRDIKDFEGYYQASNLGRIRSLDRLIEQRDITGNIYQRKMKGKILSNKRNNGNGYLVVMICKGCKTGKYKNFYIHRLVAEHFIPNVENKPEVNHKDANKSNNCVGNLEWVTSSENAKHAFDNNLNNITEYSKGKNIHGSQCHSAKINEEQAMEIYNLCIENKYTNTQIGKMFGISNNAVNNIRKKKTWKHIHIK